MNDIERYNFWNLELGNEVTKVAKEELDKMKIYPTELTSEILTKVASEVFKNTDSIFEE